MAYKKITDSQIRTSHHQKKRVKKKKRKKLFEEESSLCIFSNLSMPSEGMLRRKDKVQWEGINPKNIKVVTNWGKK